MPAPKKKGGESQSDYMGRCMHWAKNDHPDWKQDQKVAVCMTQWRGGKPQKSDVEAYIFKENIIKVHRYLSKQLASFKTTVNGDTPHYHYFDIDAAGNGTTVVTISTEDIPQQSKEHEHNISKWEVRSADGHTHALDKVVKAKRGRPCKKKWKTPTRDTFKNFAAFEKAMKDYLGKKSKSKMTASTHLTKSYLEKVMRRVIQIYVTKAGLPAGTQRQRSDGTYEKKPSGQWVRIKDAEGKPVGPTEEAPVAEPGEEAPVEPEAPGEAYAGMLADIEDMGVDLSTWTEEDIASLDQIDPTAEEINEAVDQLDALGYDLSTVDGNTIAMAVEAMREQEEPPREEEVTPETAAREELMDNLDELASDAGLKFSENELVEMQQNGVIETDLDEAITRASEMGVTGEKTVLGLAEEIANERIRGEADEEPVVGGREELMDEISEMASDLPGISVATIDTTLGRISGQEDPSIAQEMLDDLLGEIDDGNVPGVAVETPLNNKLIDLWEILQGEIDAQRGR